MRQKRRSSRDYDDEAGALGEDLAAVNDRLDELTRQLDRVTRSNSGPRNRDEPMPDRVSDALARLDRRLDQMVADSRTMSSEIERRVRVAPPLAQPMPPMAPPRPAAGGAPNWAAEISARQRALDGGAPQALSAQAYSGQTWSGPPPGQDLTGLEQQLREITSQIATLHRPYEDALSALRGDLAEVGRTLTDAMPRRAVEALEAEVRTLSERVKNGREAGADDTTLAGLERGLAEVRDTLRGLKPAESLVGFEEAVQGLSRKIDQIGAAGQDPQVLNQIEHAISSLRGVVTNVASDGALAQLAAEVHGLANRLEHGRTESNPMSPELEGSIRTLSERLDRMQLSQGDQVAMGSLEDRITKLAEKLDASDAKLSNLSAMERGIADLLVHLEEMRNGSARIPRVAPSLAPTLAQPEPAPSPVAPALALLEPVAPPPPAAVAPMPVAAAPLPAPKPAPPRIRDMQPIDPNLPPDTPLEPGSGTPRVRPGSPGARIAASEAALGGARPQMGEHASRSATVAAARHAAKSADAEQTDQPKAKSGWFKKSKKAKTAAPVSAAAAPAQPRPRPPESFTDESDAAPPRKSIGAHIKTVMIAASVVVIVLMTLQTMMDVFLPGDQAEAPASSEQRKPSAALPNSLPQFAEQPPLAPPATVPFSTAEIYNPSNTLPPVPSASDITGSINRQPPVPRATPAPVPAPAPAATQAPALPAAIAALPPSIGTQLRTAAATGNPAAEYEIAMRYTEGRGVPPNLEEAARWLEQSAKAGFVPAQFRLAALNEKGEGVKKDLNAARRLYMAAAEKGHAKAMHNLAVLYAEGIDGKPDYKIAAQWFYKAANFGVADSQYNLAILYARGIGTEQNLAESYKWFALAANKGDNDAAKKRDEVGARLDSQTLMAARLAVQSFIAQREPDEAVSVKAPLGGWDRTSLSTPAAKPKPRTPASP